MHVYDCKPKTQWNIKIRPVRDRSRLAGRNPDGYGDVRFADSPSSEREDKMEFNRVRSYGDTADNFLPGRSDFLQTDCAPKNDDVHIVRCNVYFRITSVQSPFLRRKNWNNMAPSNFNNRGSCHSGSASFNRWNP